MHVSTNGNSRGAVLAVLSTGLVQLYAQRCGKGPTRAKSHITGDSVICVMRDPYTAVERTLIDRGEIETVRRMRDGFRMAMDAEFRRVFAESFGRPLLAHMSTMHVDPDLVVDIFVAEPLPDSSPAVDGSLASTRDALIGRDWSSDWNKRGGA